MYNSHIFYVFNKKKGHQVILMPFLKRDETFIVLFFQCGLCIHLTFANRLLSHIFL